ncbi:MAG: diaminopropionate ammonia-lyase [Terrimesophilobacter sp.]
MKWYSNPAARDFETTEDVRELAAFHASLPQYAPTPLTECALLAEELGVAKVYVKDESARMGMPSFKILGASWAVFRVLSARLAAQQPDVQQPTTLAQLKERLAAGTQARLVAATDGNHGRAVAHMANLLGLPAAIFVPSGVSGAAVTAIESENATVTRIEGPYDEAVAAAKEAGAQPHSLLIQDTAWPGYTEVPGWIVEGYSSLYGEIDAQLADAGTVPDVVVTPVGVGSLILASVVHSRSRGAAHPSLLSVEPETAACVLASLHSGQLMTVPTVVSSMNGLNCGTPSTVAWPILLAGIDAAVAVSEEQTARAVRDLERLGFDSGPCGAASLAGIRVALASPESRARMGVTAASTIVLVSTESRAANPLPTATPPGDE